MNTSLWERKSIGSNDIYYMNINPKGNKCTYEKRRFIFLIVDDIFCK